MHLFEIIEQRRSVRSFNGKKIDQETVKKIVSAGILAPSAKNRQPWKFIVIYSDAEKKRMLEAVAKGQEELSQKYETRNIKRPDIMEAKKTVRIMSEAAVTVFVTNTIKYSVTYEDDVNWSLSAKDVEVADIQSIGAAIQNMILYASSLEIGSVWLCDIFYSYSALVEYLGSDEPIVAAICFGYYNDKPTNYKRRPFEELVIIK